MVMDDGSVMVIERRRCSAQLGRLFLRPGVEYGENDVAACYHLQAILLGHETLRWNEQNLSIETTSEDSILIKASVKLKLKIYPQMNFHYFNLKLSFLLQQMLDELCKAWTPATVKQMKNQWQNALPVLFLRPHQGNTDF